MEGRLLLELEMLDVPLLNIKLEESGEGKGWGKARGKKEITREGESKEEGDVLYIEQVLGGCTIKVYSMLVGL